jgi:hypothetical protein
MDPPPIPPPPDGIGALRTAAWTALCTRRRTVVIVGLFLTVASAWMAATIAVASSFDEHRAWIGMAGFVAFIVVFVAVLIVADHVKPPVFDLEDLMLSLSPIVPTWVGDDGLAFGVPPRVLRYADITVTDRIATVRDSGRRHYRQLLRIDGAGARFRWVATTDRNPASEEELAQISPAHPVHFGRAARKAWEEWRARNRPPI